MRLVKNLFCVTTLAVVNTASAQSAVYVAGEGIVECGVYLKARRDNNETQTYIYAVWVRGFLSGYNVATPGKSIQKIPGTETVLVYLDKHCGEHPLDILVTASRALAKELVGSNR